MHVGLITKPSPTAHFFFLQILAPFLIVSTPCQRNEYLSYARCRMAVIFAELRVDFSLKLNYK